MSSLESLTSLELIKGPVGSLEIVNKHDQSKIVESDGQIKCQKAALSHFQAIQTFFEECKKSPDFLLEHLEEIQTHRKSLLEIVQVSTDFADKASCFIRNSCFLNDSTPEELKKRVDEEIAFHKKQAKTAQDLLKNYPFAKADSQNFMGTPFPKQLQSSAPKGTQELFEAIQAVPKEDQTRLFQSSAAQEILKAAHENDCFEVAFWLTKNGTPLPDSTDIRFKELAALDFSVDPEHIDYHAVELGYGYKAANLNKMAKHLQTMQKKMCEAQLQVPPFAGISHHQVKHFLSQQVPELEDLWKEFLSRFGSDKQAIPEEGRAVLQKIQTKIRAAFEGENSLIDLNSQLFLHNSPAKFVIVRSTGKEDSDTNANAGGNDSVPFVPTQDPKKIREAMGQVIASYFGEKSITQRLQNGDKSVFDEPPFFPVLIQDMIFEDYRPGIPTSLENLPRSGVLFTKEEGKDPNVVTINCAFGSNEGVVASQVDVDTYQVHMETGRVYPIIRNKKSRFVQQEDSKAKSGFSVGPVENAKEFAKEHSLSLGLAHDLSKLARGFGKLYGSDGKCKEMDMEFTITYKKGPKGKLVPTIHPLQIRPLEKAKKSAPSYLSKEVLKAAESKGDCFKLSTLLDGGSSLRRVHSSEEYIVADDITKALKEYQDRGENRDKVKLIVLAKTAPLTSHEAVTLRPKGIPVLVAGEKDFLPLSKALAKASPENPMIACAQRGRVVALSSQEASSCEEQGQISYPAERALTLKHFGKPEQVADHHHKALKVIETSVNAKYNKLLSKLEESHKASPSKSDHLEKLFEEMASEDRQEAYNALSAVLKRTKNLVVKSLKSTTPFSVALETVCAYEQMMDIVEKHYLPTLEDTSSTVIERLFPLKQMEAVLMQSTSRASIVDGFSIAENAKVAKFSKESGCLGANLIYLNAMGKFALQQPVQKNWDTFVSSLKPADAMLVIQDLKTLEKHNLLPFFMNVTFKKQYASYMGGMTGFFGRNHPQKLAQALHQEIENARLALNSVEKSLPTLETWESQKENWQQPDFFNKQKALLNAQLTDIGFTPATSHWPKMFQDSSPLGRMAVLNFLNRSVTCYDEMIKQVTGSSEYEGKKQTQAKNFYHLLQGYMDMLEVHMNLCKTQSGHEDALMTPGGAYSIKKYTFDQFLKTGKNSGKSLKKHFDALQAQLNSFSFSEAAAQKLMEARQTFNVAAVAVGSKSDLDFHITWPESLEELFTTFHQSMEAINKFEQTKLGIDKSIVPQRLEAVCKSMESAGFSISRMNVDFPQVEVAYQIPLRQHSMQVTLKTDLSKKANHFIFDVQAFGNEEGNRWAQTACLGSLLAHLIPGCSFANGSPTINYPNPAGSGVSFQLKVDADACPKLANFGGLIKEFFCSGGIAYDGSSETEGHIQRMTSGKYSQTNALFDSFFRKHSEDAWLHLPGAFYENTLYPNLSAMRVAHTKGDSVKLVEVAKGTLLALKKYQLGKTFCGSSYTSNCLGSILSSQAGAASFLQETSLNDAAESSLLKNAALALWYVATNAKAPTALKAVLDDPEIKAAYPTLIASLETLNLSPQEEAQKLLSKSDVHRSVSARVSMSNFF